MSDTPERPLLVEDDGRWDYPTPTRKPSDTPIADEPAESKSQAKRRKAQGAVERTHYADDETLAYIAELEATVAELDAENRKLRECLTDFYREENEAYRHE